MYHRSTPLPALGPLDALAIRHARALAIDAVETAGSGHAGTALALTPLAHLLYQRHLVHDPAAPGWPGRDRFILSCGHASILQYVQLYLTGYGLDLDDLRRFRQAGSRTPGHPEYGHTPGVETTTGPLGQGLATGVGMAMALAHTRALADPDAAPGCSPFDRRVWVICSDGDLQEGLSHEASALAGAMGLGNLTVIFDDNRIQIDGPTSLTTREDTVARFRAQGWLVERVEPGADGDLSLPDLDAALSRGAQQWQRPALLVVRSHIAWPAPHAMDTSAAHGAPLGAAEARATKEVLGVPSEPFSPPAEVVHHTRLALTRGRAARARWDDALAAWAEGHPGETPPWDEPDAVREGRVQAVMPRFAPGERVAPRDASGQVLRAAAEVVPGLWGGSADLAESNRTVLPGLGSFGPTSSQVVEPFGESSHAGRNVHAGVREGAIAAAMNGVALVGESRLFAGTFLVFSDYQRPAIRLAALMGVGALYVWTHDSLALGADGPTHQPVEHLASLRAIPGFSVLRPADARETVAAWLAALDSAGPCGLVLARQPLPVLDLPDQVVREGVRSGGYVVRDGGPTPDLAIVATGSEVALALEAAGGLAAEGLAARVVSMPCREWFAAQPAHYRDRVLPPQLTARVVVEAAAPLGWEPIAGPRGVIVGVDSFGLSAPPEIAMAERGMTSAAVRAAAHATLASQLHRPERAKPR